MRAAPLSLLLIAFVGCTSFSGDDTRDSGLPADAGSEASVVDAGTDAASDAGKPATVFDFEKGMGDGWRVTGNPKVVSGDCNGSSQCLEAQFTNTHAFISRPLPQVPRVRIVAKVRVTAAGDRDTDLFGMKGVTGDEGAWIVHHSSGYFLQTATATGQDERTTAALFTEWTTVELTIERGPPPTIRWRVGASDPLTLTLPPAFVVRPIDLEVGGRYAMNNTTSWAVRYDDIEIYDN